MNYDVVVNFGCSFMNGDAAYVVQDDGTLVALGKNQPVAAKMLSDKFGCDYVHLSRTGASNDTIFRRLYRWVESNIKYKNPLMIIGLTETSRFSYFCEHEERFYNLHPQHINSYDDKALRLLNEKVTNNIEDPKLLRHWLEYYIKWIYNDTIESKNLQREVMFLHYYLKGNNCDYRILNALHNSLGDIKSKINYITFKDEQYQGEDNWYRFLLWQMEHIDNEKFNCEIETQVGMQQKYRNYVLRKEYPFGKRFCNGHPSPNANKELFERIYKSL